MAKCIGWTNLAVLSPILRILPVWILPVWVEDADSRNIGHRQVSAFLPERFTDYGGRLDIASASLFSSIGLKKTGTPCRLRSRKDGCLV